MKKLLSASIAAVLCAVTFCVPALAAENSEAMELYERSVKAMENVSSMEMTLDGAITATIEGTAVEIGLAAEIQQVMLSATNADLAMKMSMDVADAKINMYTYYTDGMMYQNAMGQKTAVPMDMASAIEATSSLNSFGTEYIKSITATRELGGTRLNLVLKADAINNMMADAMSSIAGSTSTSDMNMAFSDIRYTMLLDDNGIAKNYRMVMDADITAADSTVSMVFDMTCNITSVNKIFDIQFPDFSGYVMQDPVIALNK